MWSRRHAILTTTCFFGSMGCGAAYGSATGLSDIDGAIEFLASAPELLIGAGNQIDAKEFLSESLAAGPITAAPSDRKISETSKKMILLFEVTSESNYERRLRTPVFPGGKSGITIGIGYDLGYVAESQFTVDWKDLLPDSSLEALKSGLGRKGAEAKALLDRDDQIKSTEVPYTVAELQFSDRLLPRYVGLTETSLPNCEKLSNDSFGALVSLVFNRGPSFRARGDRYKEMRSILQLMTSQRFEEIPDQIRKMARIWQNSNLPGLLIRREMEAQLFEAGL